MVNIINSRWEHKLYKQTTNSAEDRGRSSHDLFLFCIWLAEEDGARFLHQSQAEVKQAKAIPNQFLHAIENFSIIWSFTLHSLALHILKPI